MSERDKIIDNLLLNGHLSLSEADLLDDSGSYFFTIISDKLPKYHYTIS